MRTSILLLSFSMVAGCDGSPEMDESPPVETQPNIDPAPTATETAAPETTTGFIEAKVDGELKRYEYLPARENMVYTRLTKMEALAGADSEEGFQLLLLGFDVRQLELPTVIRGGLREAVRGGNIAAAQRMPTVKYRDAQGNRYMLIFNDEALECQSLEELVLTCTFSGTLSGDAGTVELTEGRVQVLLGSDAMSDSFTETTVGRAADESVERVQDAIDRRRGKMR